MRRLLHAVLVMTAMVPVGLYADVTIRYTFETSSPMAAAANRTISNVIYMKGNKGATVTEGQTTILDFARQEVTVIDTARRKYATFPASEYGDRMSAQMAGMMPQAAGMGDMLKTMKTACETKKPGVVETIQGVQSEERDVVCTLSMAMPENVRQAMPAVSVKMAMHVWSAAESERLRVPGLWQLSGFEVWQNYFMNPAGNLGKMIPEGMKPMIEAMQKGQSATMRSVTEISMSMPMPGMPAGDTPFMKMDEEMTGLSTELLDDSFFSVPADCSAESFGELMTAITAAEMASMKAGQATMAPSAASRTTPLAGPSQAKPAIPENVKAYVPSLVPLTDTEPVAPVGADGKKMQGMVDLLVTLGPKGNVEQMEALSGPEGLRKPAMEAVKRWTFRPVLRNGAAVVAYTDETVDFPGDAEFEYSAEMSNAAIRLMDLEEALPRTPEQELADLEQDAGGGDKSRRYERLGELSMKALQVGVNDKAKSYATELLAEAPDHASGFEYGNSIHDGHTVLGLVALRGGDVETARDQLLKSGEIPSNKGLGWPQLNSFGPNMTLANELLKAGERNVVLEYLGMCGKFWPTGAKQLDSWSETVRQGGTPDFVGNLR